jgi:hypothetical protein
VATYSTLTEARTGYLANADYAETGDLTKAKNFASACRALLLLMPVSAQHSGEIAEFQPSLIADEMRKAQAWIAANDTANGSGDIRFFSFEGFRC